MRRKRLSLVAGVICVATALVPAGARAMTLSFGKPKLSSRILISVPLA
jgi:hypothetical protein